MFQVSERSALLCSVVGAVIVAVYSKTIVYSLLLSALDLYLTESVYSTWSRFFHRSLIRFVVCVRVCLILSFLSAIVCLCAFVLHFESINTRRYLCPFQLNHFQISVHPKCCNDGMQNRRYSICGMNRANKRQMTEIAIVPVKLTDQNSLLIFLCASVVVLFFCRSVHCYRTESMMRLQTWHFYPTFFINCIQFLLRSLYSLSLFSIRFAFLFHSVLRPSPARLNCRDSFSYAPWNASHLFIRHKIKSEIHTFFKWGPSIMRSYSRVHCTPNTR